eukprot:TRINITY_DN2188_c0_g1_i1.p1 TRINITY_DN2188_c0_g1~~TRINITY_DN2188_c0_g1_i1.p1  ORF type:complete len:1833 (+),score=178.48 TRINITY_DN2188_c0_g1_i1:645-6143(+)
MSLSNKIKRYFSPRTTFKPRIISMDDLLPTPTDDIGHLRNTLAKSEVNAADLERLLKSHPDLLPYLSFYIQANPASSLSDARKKFDASHQSLQLISQILRNPQSYNYQENDMKLISEYPEVYYYMTHTNWCLLRKQNVWDSLLAWTFKNENNEDVLPVHCVHKFLQSPCHTVASYKRVLDRGAMLSTAEDMHVLLRAMTRYLKQDTLNQSIFAKVLVYEDLFLLHEYLKSPFVSTICQRIVTMLSEMREDRKSWIYNDYKKLMEFLAKNVYLKPQDIITLIESDDEYVLQSVAVRNLEISHIFKIFETRNADIISYCLEKNGAKISREKVEEKAVDESLFNLLLENQGILGLDKIYLSPRVIDNMCQGRIDQFTLASLARRQDLSPAHQNQLLDLKQESITCALLEWTSDIPTLDRFLTAVPLKIIFCESLAMNPNIAPGTAHRVRLFNTGIADTSRINRQIAKRRDLSEEEIDTLIETRQLDVYENLARNKLIQLAPHHIDALSNISKGTDDDKRRWLPSLRAATPQDATEAELLNEYLKHFERIIRIFMVKNNKVNENILLGWIEEDLQSLLQKTALQDKANIWKVKDSIACVILEHSKTLSVTVVQRLIEGASIEQLDDLLESVTARIKQVGAHFVTDEALHSLSMHGDVNINRKLLLMIPNGRFDTDETTAGSTISFFSTLMARILLLKSLYHLRQEDSITSDILVAIDYTRTRTSSLSAVTEQNTLTGAINDLHAIIMKDLHGDDVFEQILRYVSVSNLELLFEVELSERNYWMIALKLFSSPKNDELAACLKKFCSLELPTNLGLAILSRYYRDLEIIAALLQSKTELPEATFQKLIDKHNSHYLALLSSHRLSPANVRTIRAWSTKMTIPLLGNADRQLDVKKWFNGFITALNELAGINLSTTNFVYGDISSKYMNKIIAYANANSDGIELNKVKHFLENKARIKVNLSHIDKLQTVILLLLKDDASSFKITSFNKAKNFVVEFMLRSSSPEGIVANLLDQKIIAYKKGELSCSDHSIILPHNTLSIMCDKVKIALAKRFPQEMLQWSLLSDDMFSTLLKPSHTIGDVLKVFVTVKKSTLRCCWMMAMLDKDPYNSFLVTSALDFSSELSAILSIMNVGNLTASEQIPKEWKEVRNLLLATVANEKSRVEKTKYVAVYKLVQLLGNLVNISPDNMNIIKIVGELPVAFNLAMKEVKSKVQHFLDLLNQSEEKEFFTKLQQLETDGAISIKDNEIVINKSLTKGHQFNSQLLMDELKKQIKIFAEKLAIDLCGTFESFVVKTASFKDDDIKINKDLLTTIDKLRPQLPKDFSLVQLSEYLKLAKRLLDFNFTVKIAERDFVLHRECAGAIDRFFSPEDLHQKTSKDLSEIFLVASVMLKKLDESLAGKLLTLNTLQSVNILATLVPIEGIVFSDYTKTQLQAEFHAAIQEIKTKAKYLHEHVDLILVRAPDYKRTEIIVECIAERKNNELELRKEWKCDAEGFPIVGKDGTYVINENSKEEYRSKERPKKIAKRRVVLVEIRRPLSELHEIEALPIDYIKQLHQRVANFFANQQAVASRQYNSITKFALEDQISKLKNLDALAFTTSFNRITYQYLPKQEALAPILRQMTSNLDNIVTEERNSVLSFKFEESKTLGKEVHQLLKILQKIERPLPQDIQNQADVAAVAVAVLTSDINYHQLFRDMTVMIKIRQHLASLSQRLIELESSNQSGTILLAFQAQRPGVALSICFISSHQLDKGRERFLHYNCTPCAQKEFEKLRKSNAGPLASRYTANGVQFDFTSPGRFLGALAIEGIGNVVQLTFPEKAMEDETRKLTAARQLQQVQK